MDEWRPTTVADVEQMLEGIRDLAGDPEAAHCQEDALYFLLLKAIAEGKCKDPQGCAAAAIKSEAIKFERWCA